MELIETKFKQTELGLIPEDWKVSPLKNITNLMTNGFVGTAKTQYVDSSDGILYIQGYNVKENSFNFNGIKRVNKEFHLKNSKSNLKEGDLLTVQTGDVGLTTIVPKELEGSNCHALIITRVKKHKIYPKFVAFYLNSFIGRERLREIETGTTMKHINVGDMVHFEVPLPPTIDEQKAIAQVLSDTDNLIQSIEEKLLKKKAIKQGAMQKLLAPKEDWERVKLDSVIEVNRGGSPRPIQDYITTSPNGVNWIKIGDTTKNGKYISSTKEKIIPEGVANSRKVNIGDFLLSNSMSFGRPYILKIDGCIHDGWLVLQNYQTSFDKEFLYYTLMSKNVYNQYLSKASGSGVLNLNKELVKTIELNKPKSLEEQKRIATILSDMDSEIEQLEQKLSKYKMVKQGLMQNLLTGKIRLV